MESLPLPLLIVLIVIAVVIGLWVGGRANNEIEARTKDGKPWGTRIRDAAGKGVVSLYRWNRNRKKKAKARAAERESED